MTKREFKSQWSAKINQMMKGINGAFDATEEGRTLIRAFNRVDKMDLKNLVDLKLTQFETMLIEMADILAQLDRMNRAPGEFKPKKRVAKKGKKK